MRVPELTDGQRTVVARLVEGLRRPEQVCRELQRRGLGAELRKVQSLLQRLSRAGLVTAQKVPHPGERRASTEYALTPLGLEAWRAAQAKWRRQEEYQIPVIPRPAWVDEALAAIARQKARRPRTRRQLEQSLLECLEIALQPSSRPEDL